MNYFSESKKYDDIINLPHHVSNKHQRMSIEERSAQFAPFACLTGYDEVIREAGRITNKRIELAESLKDVLDEKLQIIENKLSERPLVTFLYFIPDQKKDGGEYKMVTGKVKKFDKYKNIILLENGTQIPILDIYDITGKVFDCV